MKTKAKRGPLLGILALLSAFACSSLAQSTNVSNATSKEYALVKHRVEVIGDALAEGPGPVTVRVSEEFAEAPAGAESIRAKEHASALDLLKAKIAASEVLRLIELPGKESASNTERAPEYMVKAGFSKGQPTSSAAIRVLRKPSGALVAAADGSGGSLAEAIANAMKEVEKELLKQAWRCRVIAVNEKRIVIPYGRLDGLRKGALLRGYVLSREGRDPAAPVTELLLMTSGKVSGDYQVVEAGEEFTQLEPVADATSLEKGDVLEAPSAAISEIHRSRSSTIWDRIYEKK